ncbi:RNB domain-containing ribonuclease [Streptomyces sp. NPDC006879]|uniref:RNB domain-containing ribonuclease n=1 Tax=Streptomyces sp. NPDC006879 TaxID=3364767 RepID=UPI00367D8B80
MPRRHMRITGADGAQLRAALDSLRAKLGVPRAFPPEVLAEAEESARAPRLPGESSDLPFFTIDPAASRDLDQAVHLARRRDGGYRVHYAIADVAAFVRPGGRLDAEARRRVSTLYFPDERVPLHPPELSEDAASLLPGQHRPALLWRIDLDAEGRRTAADVHRAMVRSRARLDYEGVQRTLDTGTAEEPVALLAEIGRLREAREAERGGISLGVPEQQIREEDGSYALSYRAPLPTEGWNAQLSLLTGMAAAELMVATGTGVLRTLPSAPDGAVGRLRRSAAALHIDWPHHVAYAEIVRRLDPRVPAHAAFLQECTTLLRGAGYTVFQGGAVPEHPEHAAVAAPYTHCTAPLRRLTDRYAGELCLAAIRGAQPPQWVRSALVDLPARMAEGTRLANTVERSCVDLLEAALLEDRVGETFEATVVDVLEGDQLPARGTVQLEDPAVVATVESRSLGLLPLGRRIRVELVEADPARAKVLFAPV